MIYQAITRTHGAGEWRSRDAAALAGDITSKASLQPTNLIQFFGAVVAAGGNPAELAQLWGFEEYVRRAEQALKAGDLAGMQALIATIPAAMGTATATAIITATSGLTRSPIQSVAAESGQEPPAVDAEAVTAALEGEGWAWNGGVWVRG